MAATAASDSASGPTEVHFWTPALPYSLFSYALEPHIDALTMHLHVAKHHTAYVANLNAAIAAHPALAALPLSPAALCRMLGPSAGACAGGAKECLTLEPVEAELLRRIAGGHWNHSLFFSTMAAEPEFRGPTSAELNAAISASFGSMDGLMEAFGRAAAGRFGSGWVWLGVKPDGQLAITSTANEDNPLMSLEGVEPMIPILGLDVWEHAYYLKYHQRRHEYVDAWWNVVDWVKVSAHYTAAKEGKAFED